jgi:hypothetical protein
MTGLLDMIIIGLLGWLIGTVIVVAVIAVRANHGVISLNLADGAIFETIIAGFYSAVYSLFGAILWCIGRSDWGCSGRESG